MQCSNHGQRAGNNLCLKCGKWYCSECMSAIMPMPLCRSCADPAVGKIVLADKKPDMPEFSAMKSVRSALVIANLLLGALSLFLNLKYGIWFLYIPLGLSLLAHIPLLYLFAKPAKKGASKMPGISAAQLETLFRIADGRVTAKRLASATGTDLKVAEQYLNSLVLENKLSIGTNDTELVYTKADSLLLK